MPQRYYKSCVYQTWANAPPDDLALSLVIFIIVALTIDELKLTDALFTFSSVTMYAAFNSFLFLLIQTIIDYFCLLQVRFMPCFIYSQYYGVRSLMVTDVSLMLLILVLKPPPPGGNCVGSCSSIGSHQE